MIERNFEHQEAGCDAENIPVSVNRPVELVGGAKLPKVFLEFWGLRVWLLRGSYGPWFSDCCFLIPVQVTLFATRPPRLLNLSLIWLPASVQDIGIYIGDHALLVSPED